jgi:DMSO/TMAO reductase YedYZ molybdopterin-dependent catalytic subunit
MKSRVLTNPLPTPPGFLRQGPLRAGFFRSRLRSIALTARVGTLLGSCLLVAFVTGLASHLAQHPEWGLSFPTRPVMLYRFTQGLHVAVGLACIPLLLLKLWAVYPKLWQWPPARNLLHIAERGSLLLLVGSAIFELLTGLQNIFYWYSWPFFFTTVHYWTAWVLAGSVLLHISVKWVEIRTGWSSALTDLSVTVDPIDPNDGSTVAPPTQPNDEPAGVSRRGLLVGVAAGIGLVAVTTVGETVRSLSAFDVLGPRRPDIGPQQVPINRTARAAGVRAAATDPAYRLAITGRVATPASFSLTQLQAMTQHDVQLPIACVEGWSAGASWTGVSVRDLVRNAGASASARVQVVSLETGGRYRTSVLEADAVADHLTLLALQLNGAELDLDHGFPCRLIAADRPGVMQTKWVTRLEVL